MKNILLLTAASALYVLPAAAQTRAPDAARLKANVEKLVSFGTRHTLSSATDPKRGIGAARTWGAAEFAKQLEGVESPGGFSVLVPERVNPVGRFRHDRSVF